VSLEIKDVLRIIDAYGVVLSRASYAVRYLLYLSGSILAGWSTGLFILLLGLSVPSIALSVATFAVVFILASISSSIIDRIGLTQRLLALPPEKKIDSVQVAKRVGRWILIAWGASFLVASPVSLVLLRPPLAVIAIPMIVTFGLAFGNLGIFLAVFRIAGVKNLQPLFVTVYLLLTAPTYFLLIPAIPGDHVILAYILLTVHTSVSNFGAAVWYLLSSRKAASGILNAARGEA
jgi:hypothetical protein